MSDELIIAVQERIEVVTEGIQGPPGVGGGLAAVADDPAPALGGDLTLGVHNIVGTLENNTLILDGGLL